MNITVNTTYEEGESPALELYIILLTVLFLSVGIFGNLLVILCYIFRLKLTNQRWFIPFLTAADLLTCLSPLVSVIGVYGLNERPPLLCKLGFYTTFSTATISVGILLLISVDRYLIDCRPTKQQMTIFRKKCALVIIIVFAFILYIPMFFFKGKYTETISYGNITIIETRCGNRKLIGTDKMLQKIYSGLISFISIAALVAISGFYFPVGLSTFSRFRTHTFRQKPHGQAVKDETNSSHTFAAMKNDKLRSVNKSDLSANKNTEFGIHISENRIPSSDENHKVTITNGEESPSSGNTDVSMDQIKLENTQKNMVNSSKNERRKKVRQNFTGMFMTIIVIYLIAYTPSVAVEAYLAYSDVSEFAFFSNSRGLLVVQFTFIMNHIVNPFIYGYFDFTFRKEFVEFICFWK